ncbi:MAG: GHKL domain-containing protein [Chloroflexi bacterium]|nr:GHKL domain-containing protein [Chloroflexota bacterium]
MEQVALNSLIEKRIYELQGRSPYEAVSFHLSLDPNASVLRANSIWLRRLLDILIDNAIDAMRETTKKYIGISTMTSEQGVTISVSDTGKGITDQLGSSLFYEASKHPPRRQGKRVIYCPNSRRHLWWQN